MVSKITSNLVMDLPGSPPSNLTGFTRNLSPTPTALFPNTTPCLAVVVVGGLQNTEPAYIGGADSQYMFVKAGEMIQIWISDASKLYIRGRSGDVLNGHILVA